MAEYIMLRVKRSIYIGVKANGLFILTNRPCLREWRLPSISTRRDENEGNRCDINHSNFRYTCRIIQYIEYSTFHSIEALYYIMHFVPMEHFKRNRHRHVPHLHIHLWRASYMLNSPVGEWYRPTEASHYTLYILSAMDIDFKWGICWYFTRKWKADRAYWLIWI